MEVDKPDEKVDNNIDIFCTMTITITVKLDNVASSQAGPLAITNHPCCAMTLGNEDACHGERSSDGHVDTDDEDSNFGITSVSEIIGDETRPSAPRVTDLASDRILAWYSQLPEPEALADQETHRSTTASATRISTSSSRP